MISISNPVVSTWIIAVTIICFLIFSARPKKPGALFSPVVTKELKGAAILMIVFSHIGYFMSNDPRFLWPLSIFAGVGVNIFLFLSAYGLSMSNIQSPLSVWKWYKKRLPKLFVSLWIVLGIFFFMDYFILHRSYPFQYAWHSMIGYFPSADISQDIDSVLWYFTFILFYYLLYPILFLKKHIWISSILLLLSMQLLIHFDSFVSSDLLKLYKVHSFAFPLGVLVAWASTTSVAFKVSHYLTRYTDTVNSDSLGVPVRGLLVRARHGLLLLALLMIIGYLSVHSGVGQSVLKEQFLSLCTVALILLLFVIKKVEFKFLSLFGVFSYEIYLFHWPLLSRYDIFYRHMPAWLATLTWLGIFIMLGWCLHIVSEKFQTRHKRV
jgi:peptidoglycan/LPS O-acetylase OafA/YrhL